MNRIFKSELFRIWKASDKTVYLNRTGMSNDWYKMESERDLYDARFADLNGIVYELLK